MNDDVPNGPGAIAEEVFAALRRRKNVLITGPPGTGKTRLLTEVARWFDQIPTVPGFDPQGGVPFPPRPEADAGWLLSPNRTDRKTFKMVFYSGTRHRHVLRGLEPEPGEAGAFRYSRGTLFEANEHARRADGASLLIIDEINRGPAVEAFGEAVVAIESDKRLDDDGTRSASSYPIQLPSLNGHMYDYYFSAHLYVLAAMNEADASVAPMDVAFRRRWEVVTLLPDVDVARSELGLLDGPGAPGSAQELLGAFVDAWVQVNERVSLLRGSEYQLGHAVAIPEPGRDLANVAEAALFVRERWSQLEQHLGEVFFGDPRAEVAALAGGDEQHYSLEQLNVGTEPATRMVRPQPANPVEWLALLQALAQVDE